jgi:hypothetical protein
MVTQMIIPGAGHGDAERYFQTQNNQNWQPPPQQSQTPFSDHAASQAGYNWESSQAPQTQQGWQPMPGYEGMPPGAGGYFEENPRILWDRHLSGANLSPEERSIAQQAFNQVYSDYMWGAMQNPTAGNTFQGFLQGYDPRVAISSMQQMDLHLRQMEQQRRMEQLSRWQEDLAWQEESRRQARLGWEFAELSRQQALASWPHQEEARRRQQEMWALDDLRQPGWRRFQAPARWLAF